MTQPLFAGIELGGTKCVCLIGTGPKDIRFQTSVPTGNDSDATLTRIEGVLRDGFATHGAIRSLGIASFGPIDRTPGSPGYGYITSTPKSGWRHTSVAQRMAQRFDLPVVFDTDVNGAALAEGLWGGAQGLADFAYVTVGTGVGVGLMTEGRLVHGFAPSLRRQLLSSLSGYLDLEALAGSIDRYVVSPGLGSMAGPLGALALAIDQS